MYVSLILFRYYIRRLYRTSAYELKLCTARYFNAILSVREFVDFAVAALTYSVSQKKIPREAFGIFSQTVEQFLHLYYTFLSTLDYKFLFNYLQL